MGLESLDWSPVYPGIFHIVVYTVVRSTYYTVITVYRSHSICHHMVSSGMRNDRLRLEVTGSEMSLLIYCCRLE